MTTDFEEGHTICRDIPRATSLCADQTIAIASVTRVIIKVSYHPLKAEPTHSRPQFPPRNPGRIGLLT